MGRRERGIQLIRCAIIDGSRDRKRIAWLIDRNHLATAGTRRLAVFRFGAVRFGLERIDKVFGPFGLARSELHVMSVANAPIYGHIVQRTIGPSGPRPMSCCIL